MTNEELLADIRNKLSPAATLISLSSELYSKGKTPEQYDKLYNYIKDILPDTKESIKYLKEFKL